MSKIRLVLASASPARWATLRRAGIDPIIEVSAVDEEAVAAELRAHDPQASPADVALVLATAKARDVAVRRATTAGPERELVLGCDSILDLDGVPFGKPAGAAEAMTRWRAMSGRTGILHTGHWIVDRPGPGRPAREIGATASTTVHFANLDEEEITAYVATGEPLAVAGAFTIDGIGGPFVTGIQGDPHNVVGLSLPLLRTMVSGVGVRWFDLVANR